MKIAAFIIALSAVSCSHSKKAVHFEERFSRLAKIDGKISPSTDAERLVLKYREAFENLEINSSKACQLFTELETSEVTQLELIKQLILLRKFQACAPQQPLKGFTPTTELEQDALDFQINHLSSQYNEQIIEMLLTKSKSLAPLNEKIKLVDRAIELAEKNRLASLSEKAKKRKIQIAPRFTAEIQNSNRLSVANDFASHLNYVRAIELFAEHIRLNKGQHEEVYQGLLGIRNVNRLNRHNDIRAYLVACEKVAQFTKTLFKIKKYKKAWTNRFYDAQVFWARALWTNNDRDSAEKILINTTAQIKNFKTTEQIQWILSRIEIEKNNPDSALKYLSDINTSVISDAELKDDIEWDRAWLLYKMKNPEASNAFLAISQQPKANSRLRAKFWYARTLTDATLKEQQLQQMIKEEPLSYYSILAQRDLKLPFSPYLQRPPHDMDELWKRGVNNRELSTVLATADVLIGFAEGEIVTRYLDRNKLVFFKSSQNSLDFKMLYLDLYARAQSYRSLFITFQNLSAEEQKKILVMMPSFVFPTPYKAEVLRASQKSNVPSELIYSIMRQESSFNASARSLADAFGLMQLLPSIAQELAYKNQLELKNAAHDLYDPRLNVMLGSLLLEKNLKRWNRSGIYATAAYNASEDAVQLWSKRREAQQDALESIEEIPYRETQLYVKLVIRNYLHYSRILKSHPFLFEEWLLKL